jgi:uncharacterized protein YndB with AHSA1/START domain
MSAPLPPIRRQVDVAWPQAEAFRRFTADFGTWWPRRTHSIGGRMVKEVVFECREGGRIFEVFHDGRRFLWGTVTKWEPPHAVSFTWHPSKEASQAQEVELTFTPNAGGTAVVLTSSGWEKYGDRAARERKGYDIGWGAVLATWAGKWSVAQTLFGLIVRGATAYLRVTGKLEESIAKSGGRME